MAILAGVVAFLATQQVAGSFARLKDKRAAQREVAALRRVTLELDQSLNATRTRMDDLSKEFEAKNQQQGKKIVSELKILEGLMREFAGRVSNRARAVQDTIEPAQVMQTGKPCMWLEGQGLCRQHGEQRVARNHSRRAWKRTVSIFICSPS